MKKIIEIYPELCSQYHVRLSKKTCLICDMLEKNSFQEILSKWMCCDLPQVCPIYVLGGLL